MLKVKYSGRPWNFVYNTVILGIVGENSTFGLGVKSAQIKETTEREDCFLYNTDGELQKYRFQKGFGTLVVYTVTYEY